MSEQQDSEALTRVMLDASKRSVPIEIVPRAKVNSLEEAAAALGVHPSQLLKTLVLKRSDDTYVFALIPGGRKMDWAKIRSVLQVNKLSLPDAETALAVTHFARGTITPFGSHTPLPVLIDSSVFDEPVPEKIALGSGDPGHGLLVSPEAFVAGFEATIADISVPQ
ncbi:YbaK/EbsC family protein [Glutamicibacter sp.]|uniref:aminoacyl-tRNA deacylase n=1 Tax=Glutamicibacter sp. TaxID=1931995 RepID=UPI0028BF2AF7|nr:YbaK/EbsC family protein [Glutamicibacter sp.]